LALVSSADFKNIDIFYMTRFQKERYAEGAKGDYMKVDSKFLKDAKYDGASVLHPLPRVGELAQELDSLPRAAYFRQAAYGVPIRMALIAAVLELDKEHGLEAFKTGFRTGGYPVHQQPRDLGLTCPNRNCITHDPHDGDYAANKFYVVAPERLRCYYCETDIEAVADKAGYKPGKHSAAAE
jgi:Aspartate/ornithine carbamoyltransferase, Asp/Orn binding domain/Aspartate carbamoyltransferase regulatory chain, metal binding domain